MLGVTFFGLMLTPVFYVILRKLSGAKPLRDKHGRHPHIHGPDGSPVTREPAEQKVQEPALQD